MDEEVRMRPGKDIGALYCYTLYVTGEKNGAFLILLEMFRGS